MTDTEARSRKTLTVVAGEGVPEGIAYPCDDGLSPFDTDPYERWRQEALASGRASWRAIGDRKVLLVRKGWNVAVHAVRTAPRGYGKKRQYWNATTECGQIMYEGQGWAAQDGLLGDTTCLICRKSVRERYEREREYDDPRVDEDMDEYERLRAEEAAWNAQEVAWEEQRRYHEADEPSDPAAPSSDGAFANAPSDGDTASTPDYEPLIKEIVLTLRRAFADGMMPTTPSCQECASPATVAFWRNASPSEVAVRVMDDAVRVTVRTLQQRGLLP